MAQRRGGARRNTGRDALADGVLVRFLVTEGPWAEDLPPVPDGFTVTVSFGSEMLADEHRDALALLGYRVVDLPAVARLAISRMADFLIIQELIEHHPTYWRSLAGQAARAYHLALGPAAALVRDIVAAHMEQAGQRPLAEA